MFIQTKDSIIQILATLIGFKSFHFQYFLFIKSYFVTVDLRLLFKIVRMNSMNVW